MEDKKLTEQESLELIAKTIERARKTEIGRLNFLTLYGALGLVVTILTWVWPKARLEWLWMAVSVISYGVPFVYHKMWKKPMTVTGRIVKKGWGNFAFMGVFAAFCAAFFKPEVTTGVMVMVGSCAVFLLSGLFKRTSIMGCAFTGLGVGIIFVTNNGESWNSWNYWLAVFLAYCTFTGVTINIDDNED